MNKMKLIPAPIDNKNIIEEFADDISIEFDDGRTKRETFWRNGSLYLVDYKFGSHRGIIKCLYGEPTQEDTNGLKADIENFLNDNTDCVCRLAIYAKDILFAFYWRVE